MVHRQKFYNNCCRAFTADSQLTRQQGGWASGLVVCVMEFGFIREFIRPSGSHGFRIRHKLHRIQSEQPCIDIAIDRRPVQRNNVLLASMRHEYGRDERMVYRQSFHNYSCDSEIIVAGLRQHQSSRFINAFLGYGIYCNLICPASGLRFQLFKHFFQ